MMPPFLIVEFSIGTARSVRYLRTRLSLEAAFERDWGEQSEDDGRERGCVQVDASATAVATAAAPMRAPVGASTSPAAASWAISSGTA